MTQATAAVTELPVSMVREHRLESVPAAHDDGDRNPIFDALVSPEGEVAGLVAYSLYKQNKRAWLDDFVKLTGRHPTEAESRAYIIGESTQRRLATYRQLAEATLSGKSPSTGGARRMGAAGWLGVAIVAVLALALLGFALHAANVPFTK